MIEKLHKIEDNLKVENLGTYLNFLFPVGTLIFIYVRGKTVYVSEHDPNSINEDVTLIASGPVELDYGIQHGLH